MEELKKLCELEEKARGENFASHNVALVHLNLKDGTFIRASKEYDEKIKELLEKMDLVFKRGFVENEVFFHVTKDQEHLNKFDIPENRIHPDKPGGRFYGYPEKSVQEYESYDGPFTEVYNDFLDEIGIEEKERIFYLVNYIPAPNKESLRKALKEEIKRREKLQEYDFLVERHPRIKDCDETKRVLRELSKD